MNEAIWPTDLGNRKLAVLCSGGLDSAVLLGEACQRYDLVQPIYIATGSTWETLELSAIRQFIQATHFSQMQPLKILTVDTRDLYDNHWSHTGKNVPDHLSPDEAVYLPGRNVVLLAKSLIWCHLQGIATIATAPLAANPFPDATPTFYRDFAQVVGVAVGDTLKIIRPYEHLNKSQVVLRGAGMPLEHTFSCIAPIYDHHCGACNKCAERIAAFQQAGVPDPTVYANCSNNLPPIPV